MLLNACTSDDVESSCFVARVTQMASAVGGAGAAPPSAAAPVPAAAADVEVKHAEAPAAAAAVAVMADGDAAGKPAAPAPELVQLDPLRIRFTQKQAAKKFSCGRNVCDTIAQLR